MGGTTFETSGRRIKPVIEPKQGTECYRLLKAMRRGRVTSLRAAKELNITSLHRRITDLKVMGWTVNQCRVSKLDDRGKEVKSWKEYWVD